MENEAMPQEVDNAQNEQKESKIDLRGSVVLGGTFEMTCCMALMGFSLIACMFINSMWIKGMIAGVCAIIFSVPIVARVMRSRNTIDAEKVIDILKK